MISSDDGCLKEAVRQLDLNKYRPCLGRSLFYLCMDLLLLALVLVLVLAVTAKGHYFLSFLLSLLAGNLFFFLFVSGHEGRHGSFARSKVINNVLGFVLHHFPLTPYWSCNHVENKSPEQKAYPLKSFEEMRGER